MKSIKGSLNKREIPGNGKEKSPQPKETSKPKIASKKIREDIADFETKDKNGKKVKTETLTRTSKIAKNPVDKTAVTMHREKIDRKVNSHLRNVTPGKENMAKEPKSVKTISNSINVAGTSRNSKISSDKKVKQMAGYAEKRGTSTIYVPKAEVLRGPISGSNSKRKIANGSFSEKKRGEKLGVGFPEVEAKKDKKIKDRSKENLEGEKQEPEIEGGDYEDDFESYESDFQECTESEVSFLSDDVSSDLEPIEMKTQEKPTTKIVNSSLNKKTEEERIFDSGHYELAEARKRAAKVESVILIDSRMLEDEEVEKSEEPPNLGNKEEKQVETKSLLSTDEGFEDERSGDFLKTVTVAQIPKKEKVKKNIRKMRGQELMGMIKLDIVEFFPFERKPIAYEEFVRIYGNSNSRQVAVQTKEDNTEMDVQTEDIEYDNKWSQFPVLCRNSLETSDDINRFQTELFGVGGDYCVNLPPFPPHDILRLNDFLSRAGKVVLALLEKNNLGGNILQNGPQNELPFSDGFVDLSTGSVFFLSHRAVSNIRYSEMSNKILMTIHASKENEYDEKDDVTNFCVGCTWNICEPSSPVKIFYSRSDITICSFHPTNCNIVFAGTQDGSINIWNLNEDVMWHQKIKDEITEIEWTLRSPTYTTSGGPEIQHKAEIVGLTVLSKTEKDSIYIPSNRFSPIQICSLDANGRLLIWSLLKKTKQHDDDVNSSFWGEIVLIQSQEIPLNYKGASIMENPLHSFVYMEKDSVNVNHLYLATNTSEVIHATCFGSRISPNVYKNDFIEFCGGSTHIEACPYEKSYFFVGCNDGTIRLHSMNKQKALLQLKSANKDVAVNILQWSKSKPFCLFVLDEFSRIHLWNLGNNDTTPMQVINTSEKKRIKFIQLSPCNVLRDFSEQYLAIGTDEGIVEVHKLKAEFYYSHKEDINRELKAFLEYVSIL